MMDVVLAENAGTCFGVQRALDLAQGVLDERKQAMTLGALIHNPRVVSDFERQGMLVANAPAEVTTPTVVIRSHGVLPQVREELDARGLEVVDATCPYVVRAQKKAAKLAATGNDVLIVGEQGHPEVLGLEAWAKSAGGRVVVVACGADVPGDLSHTVGIVVQTTQREAVLDDVVEACEARGLEVVVENTICSATTERQDAAAELAKRADAMVVLGGRNSSNTTRLAEVCRQHCGNTMHVEDASELKREDFDGCGLVGVTAGASTPRAHIDEVLDRLASFSA